MPVNSNACRQNRYAAEDFFKGAAAANFSLSPDGKQLAYLATVGEGLGLFVRNITREGPCGAVRRLTDPNRHTILNFVWKGNHRILMACDTCGDENYHIYCMDVRAGASCEPVDLTPFSNTQAVLLDILRHASSEVLIAHNHRAPHLLDVYRIDVVTGNATLLASNPGNIVGWFADEDGEVRLAQSSGREAGLHVRGRADSAWRQIAAFGFDEIVTPLAFVPGMPNHVYVLSNRQRDTLALYEFDLESGRESRCLYQREDADIGGIIWSNGRRKMLGVMWTDTMLRYRFFDARRRLMQMRLRRALPGQQIVVKSGAADESIFIVSAASDTCPEHHYLYSAAEDRLTPLGSTLPHLCPDDMATMEPVHFTAHDGLRIHGYLSRPVGKAARRIETPALIVFPHGGPWARDTWGFNRIVQWLAHLGFAVLQINFRGSVGYGRRFWRAGFRQWGDGIQRDIEAAVHWAVGNGVVLPDRIGIFGFSFGGYSALMQIARNPTMYRCAVDYSGTTDLQTFLASIPATWEPMREALREMIGDPSDEVGRAALDRASPLRMVDRIGTPVLVAHGAGDPRVNVSESERLVDELQKRNVPAEYVVFQDEGHGFANPRNMIAFYERTARFFETWFEGKRTT